MKNNFLNIETKGIEHNKKNPIIFSSKNNEAYLMPVRL